jgi:hypothetical protein
MVSYLSLSSACCYLATNASILFSVYFLPTVRATPKTEIFLFHAKPKAESAQAGGPLP